MNGPGTGLGLEVRIWWDWTHQAGISSWLCTDSDSGRLFDWSLLPVGYEHVAAQKKVKFAGTLGLAQGFQVTATHRMQALIPWRSSFTGLALCQEGQQLLPFGHLCYEYEWRWLSMSRKGLGVQPLPGAASR